MATDKEIIKLKMREIKRDKNSVPVEGTLYDFILKMMSLARQEEQNKITDHLGIKVREAYEKGVKDERKKALADGQCQLYNIATKAIQNAPLYFKQKCRIMDEIEKEWRILAGEEKPRKECGVE
jgi:hypothetical protein